MSIQYLRRAAAALALLAGMAQAAPVPEESDAQPSADAQNFSLQTETAAAIAAQADSAVSRFGFPSAAASRPERQALALQADAEAESRAALSLTLWNFARSIQAQQEGNPFEMLQASLALQEFQLAPQDAVTAVPLPGAAWLFVMGVLGLAGSRITRTSVEGAATNEAHTLRDAVPA